MAWASRPSPRQSRSLLHGAASRRLSPRSRDVATPQRCCRAEAMAAPTQHAENRASRTSRLSVAPPCRTTCDAKQGTAGGEDPHAQQDVRVVRRGRTGARRAADDRQDLGTRAPAGRRWGRRALPRPRGPRRSRQRTAHRTVDGAANVRIDCQSRPCRKPSRRRRCACSGTLQPLRSWLSPLPSRWRSQRPWGCIGDSRTSSA